MHILSKALLCPKQPLSFHAIIPTAEMLPIQAVSVGISYSLLANHISISRISMPCGSFSRGPDFAERSGKKARN